jgi:hypothetical protein
VVPYRASISTPMGLGILQATKFEFAPSQLAQHESELNGVACRDRAKS